MNLDRRRLLALAGRGALAAGGGGLLATGLAARSGAEPDVPASVAPAPAPARLAAEYDYVVVGSGAGGGPLAVRLAEAGRRVLLLEAGPAEPDPERYAVPAFHLRASTDPEMSWDFFVRHYTDPRRHGRRFRPELGGMLYPRAATIGGCTAHHAMLTMAPEDRDWAEVVRATGDDSWNPFAMREHQRAVLDWLPVEQVPPTLLTRDRAVARLVLAAAAEAGLPLPRPGREIDLNTLDIAGLLPDPNDRAHLEAGREGLFLIPQSTRDGRRRGARERVLEALPGLGGRLTVQTDALVERVVLSEGTDSAAGTVRATAVVFRHGRHLYRASPRYRSENPWTRRSVRVRHEVILAGGAFNSPQLLMLSGIGPAAHLRRHGISVRVPLEGVGTNLQDRYEMSVVTRHRRGFDIAADCTFGAEGDPCLAEWRQHPERSVYRSNGIVVGARLRSPGGADHPEVFVFGSPSRFEGYQPGFDRIGLADRSYFTWAVLKGWSANHTGTVRLASADPTVPPDINFRYFDDGAGGPGAERDLAGVVHGLRFARRVNQRAEQLTWLDQNSGTEVFPGPGLTEDGQLAAATRREAWGHHASCSNPMGRVGDGRSVVDARLRVHGTSNLRVVDASVFPRIPGLFPVLAVHTLAEKAASDILGQSVDRAGA